MYVLVRVSAMQNYETETQKLAYTETNILKYFFPNWSLYERKFITEVYKN